TRRRRPARGAGRHPEALRAPGLEPAGCARQANHVHVIVEAETRPERIMNEFKSYASRELNQLTSETPDRKRWARHGSTGWLWEDEDVRHALQYVIDEQGEPMAVFIADEI